ncbi:hypothetical protein D5039_21740 [Verminephrobacter aporrectodeae subsp. tuberculatae]|uniref:Uncharacterized protein n=1 Tax=Verminephrobacter aporrectodeae subsp. tuberculatae TaxID=1110392 RepID=A0ABT3KZC6_9BURK|nr:hypothetical protein [Verminephrobacter aporrectodeae]MCW5323667.1 hypothetical protein [Verminephrobacter aporrectodeae subsp. tuberculatae]
MKTLSIVLVLLCSTFARESLAGPTVYTRQHDVLAAAIRNGKSSGVMEGTVAEHFTRQFRSTGQLLVTATVIKSFSRADCKRLEIVFTKKDVDTPQGRTDAILKTQLNYCLNGAPPISVE